MGQDVQQPQATSLQKSCQFEGGQCVCPELFSTEEPGKHSSLGACTSAAHFNPAHSAEIWPCPPHLPQMLVGAGDQAEAPGVEGLFGASLVFLLFCPFVAFPALRGIFGSLSLLALGESYNSRMEVAGGNGLCSVPEKV